MRLLAALALSATLLATSTISAGPAGAAPPPDCTVAYLESEFERPIDEVRDGLFTGRGGTVVVVPDEERLSAVAT